MALVFGMDEAGYGPNLGPLVITVTAWEVPNSPIPFDFWAQLADVVARPESGTRNGNQISVGDSKAVYTPARGIAELERSVLTILSSSKILPTTFQQLSQTLTASDQDITVAEPWYRDELALPITETPEASLVSHWRSVCERAGITLRGIACDVVLTERFNKSVRDFGSKGLALSRFSMKLLRRLWDPDHDHAAQIIADKHGGRNRYDDLLAEVLGDQFIFRLEESTAKSCYRVGATEIRFQTKAEAHFPVAVASMVSKYLRELAMVCFNRYWQSHLPEIKPTKGYPVDARRFRKDIADRQKQMGISDHILWRER